MSEGVLSAESLIHADGDQDEVPQIYPLVSDRANEKMLVEWLSDIEEYAVVDPDAPLEEVSFDLCVVDEAGFQRHLEALRDRKEQAKPVLLPYLLLLPEGDSELLRSDYAELADTAVTATFDEILTLPVLQAELRWRIESLLRLRTQTQQLSTREQVLQQFKQAVDAAGHAIYITDTDGRITYTNPAFEEITGYDREEVIGETPKILKSGKMSADYYDSLWETLQAGGVWEEELVNRTKKGDLYQAHQTISPVTGEDGDINWYVAVQTDITDRKQLETLRRQYRQAIESSIEAIAAIDRDGNYLFANETYRSHHGLNSEDDIHGLSYEDVLSEEAVQAIEPHLDAALEGEIVEFEMTRTLQDRGDRALHIMYYPLEDEASDQQGVIASIRDVTSEKERIRRLETLVSSLPGIVYRCLNKAEWPMQFVGGKCQSITGYSSEELETGAVTWGGDIVHPEDKDRVIETINEQIAVGDSFELTYRILTADGNVRWVWEHGQDVDPLTHSNEMLEGFIMDITDRKERERELQQKTQAIDTAPIGIYITDPTKRGHPIIYANKGYAEITGYAREQAIGREFGFLQGEHTDPEVTNRIDKEIEQSDRVSVQLRNYRADGTEFWCNLELAPVRDGNGDVINWIGFIQDVTDRVERQRQLQLIDRVLRHNLRNDLNVVQGLAEVIRAEADGDLSQYADRILDTSSSLLETMEKERNITQILEDEPVLEPIEVIASIESTANVLENHHPEATIDVIGPDEARVRATTGIHRAIEELLTNAVEHYEGETPHIEVEVTKSAHTVTVQIRDNGPGIPEMELDVLSGEKEQSPLYHGIGLGLWMVYLIVRRSVGKIEFAENDPTGSVVTLRLPTAVTNDR